MGISWAYLWHILGISRAYLGHNMGISRAFLGTNLGTFFGYLPSFLPHISHLYIVVKIFVKIVVNASPSASNVSIFGIFY